MELHPVEVMVHRQVADMVHRPVEGTALPQARQVVVTGLHRDHPPAATVLLLQAAVTVCRGIEGYTDLTKKGCVLMGKVLIAVDDTKSSMEIFSDKMMIGKCIDCKEYILLYVEQFCGRSIMCDVIPDTELETLKEVLEGSEYKSALDTKAQRILEHYRLVLAEKFPDVTIRTMVKSGHPAEEILKTAQEEDVGLIILGAKKKRGLRFLMGSVSREVAETSDRAVLIMK